MKTRDVIKQLRADGWYQVSQRGSHIQMKHPTKRGRVTVVARQENVPPKTRRTIERQAGIKLKGK